ncbi:bcaA [Symbiodinium sp. KB8]|nr:bcaA [Symbiodinium sp. KB8]
MLSRSVAAAAAVARVQARAMSTGWAPLDASKMVTKLTDKPKTKVAKEELKFGTTFTDHMVEVDWDNKNGWHAPEITPYHKIPIDPAASVLHYSLECFEGMKAYVDKEGNVRLFRPDMNMNRMHTSMLRLALPDFDKNEWLECIKQLIRVDKEWIPRGEGYSLYIRPTGISTHPFLGVGASSQAKMFTILSPVGPYYPEGFAPVTLYGEKRYVRAWPGGTGDTKVGANYGPTIQPQLQAADRGYSQVLWLFGDQDGGQVTEVGIMNLFILWVNEEGEKELVTAALDGTILPGVTRDSILELARSWGEFKVTERSVTMGEVTRAIESGRLIEAFGSGTAAVVAPIKRVHFQGKDYPVPIEEELQSGVTTKRVWDELKDIQYGNVEHPWSVVIDRL